MTWDSITNLHWCYCVQSSSTWLGMRIAAGESWSDTSLTWIDESPFGSMTYWGPGMPGTDMCMMVDTSLALTNGLYVSLGGCMW